MFGCTYVYPEMQRNSRGTANGCSNLRGRKEVGARYLEALQQVIDPADLKWIFVSHTDLDMSATSMR